MNEDEKLHNELEENYEKIVEMLSNGNFLQLNDKAISLTELNEYINAQQEEIHRLNNIIKEVRNYIENDMPYLQEVDEEFENVDGEVYFTYKEWNENNLLDILKGVDKE